MSRFPLSDDAKFNKAERDFDAKESECEGDRQLKIEIVEAFELADEHF